MNTIVLLTGGNLGNRTSILTDAKKAIELQVGKINQASVLIESKAWGFESAHPFLNQILIVSTNQSAIEVLNTIQQIELDLGRVRKKEQWSSRLIDIDILFFNTESINSDRLTIPHKHIRDRRFTLYGLNTIIPEFNHPQYNKTIEQLLVECSDKSKVGEYHA
jgi:2-amino-4-hydroxy-6-hydroxymethyldihydropteridine diphosphokinase